MKKGVSKQVFTYVVLLALVALVAAYFFGYKKYTDLAATTQLNNEALQAEVDDLKKYYINEAQYRADMVPMNEKILAVLDKYPADSRQEDVIMHGVTTQKYTPITFSTINLGQAEVIKTIDENTVKGIGNENLQSAIRFVKRDAAYVNQVSYESLKNVVQAAFDSEYNIGISRISYSKAGGNMLSGTIDLTFYSVRGNGKEYTLPDMIPYESGAANIFGYTPVEETEETESAETTENSEVIENTETMENVESTENVEQ